MSEIAIQNQIKESNENDNQPKTIENTTLIDGLLDSNSFTSIENLNIESNNTIINNDYIACGEDKNSNFLDLIKQNNIDNDKDSSLTQGISKDSSDLSEQNYKVITIDDSDADEVEELVNNKLLKRVGSNDSIELKRHKSLPKIENFECLAPFINETEDSSETKINDTNIIDEHKNNIYESVEHYTKITSYESFNSNDSNIKSSNIKISNIHSPAIYSPEIKTHKKDNSYSYSIANRNKLLSDATVYDLKFVKCTSLNFEKDNKTGNIDYSLMLSYNGTSRFILKSSLKKNSMFNSDCTNLPKKHVQILDSVTIINPKEEDKRKSFKKGFRAIRKSFSSNSTKTGDKDKNIQSSSLGSVTITTECLNDVEKHDIPKHEDNHSSSNSKVDKIINHCRRLSFSKMGRSNSNESNTSSKNDYRKDIEKLRKKYALVEEKPKSKYYTLMKMLNINSTEEEFLALSSLEVYYKNIDVLPNEIGDLINLRILYLNDNKIRVIPPDIGKLTNLYHLDLSFNILSNLPKEIGNLKNLRKLILNGNKLIEIPEEIGTMTELKILQLQNNLLTDIPTSIIKLEFLVELNISKNKIKKLSELFDEMKKRCKM
ncbi:L domain-like protein [Neocallimastix lanati (nom. inval.)]|nr:L domain-like protein [Neocallimastix sp. JGI-2020a]